MKTLSDVTTLYLVNQIADDVFVPNGHGQCKASQPFQKLKKPCRFASKISPFYEVGLPQASHLKN